MRLLDNKSWHKVINGDPSLGLCVSNGCAERISGSCYYPRFDSGHIFEVSFNRIEDRTLHPLPLKTDEHDRLFVEVRSQTTIVAGTVEQFDVGLNLVGITFGRMYDNFTGWSTGTELIEPGYGEARLHLVTTNNASNARPFFLDSFLPELNNPDFGPAMKVLFFVEEENVEAITGSVGNEQTGRMQEQMIDMLQAEVQKVQKIPWRVRRIRRYTTIGAGIIAVVAFILWFFGLIGETLMASMLSAVVALLIVFLPQILADADKR